MVLTLVELSFTSEHHSKLSWVLLQGIGPLLKHKSLERKHLTFSYDHSPPEGMHKCKHGRITNDISFWSGNILHNMSLGWKRMWHFQGVCCRMATKTKKALTLTETVHSLVLKKIYSHWKPAQPAGPQIIFKLLKKHLFLVGHYRNVCVYFSAYTCDSVCFYECVELTQAGL